MNYNSNMLHVHKKANNLNRYSFFNCRTIFFILLLEFLTFCLKVYNTVLSS